MVYADLGPDNGGFPINVSEEGLAFQGIQPLEMDQVVPIKFKLPGIEHFVSATGQVAWVNDSRKGGGLRFIDLPDNDRRVITGWLSLQAQHATAPATIKQKPRVTAAKVQVKEAEPLKAVPVAANCEEVAPKSEASAEVSSVAALLSLLPSAILAPVELPVPTPDITKVEVKELEPAEAAPAAATHQEVALKSEVSAEVSAIAPAPIPIPTPVPAPLALPVSTLDAKAAKVEVKEPESAEVVPVAATQEEVALKSEVSTEVGAIAAAPSPISSPAPVPALVALPAPTPEAATAICATPVTSTLLNPVLFSLAEPLRSPVARPDIMAAKAQKHADSSSLRPWLLGSLGFAVILGVVVWQFEGAMLMNRGSVTSAQPVSVSEIAPVRPVAPVPSFVPSPSSEAAPVAASAMTKTSTPDTPSGKLVAPLNVRSRRKSLRMLTAPAKPLGVRRAIGPPSVELPPAITSGPKPELASLLPANLPVPLPPVLFPSYTTQGNTETIAVPRSTETAAAQLITQRNPVYPPMARASGLAGTVELHFMIGTNGAVRDISVVKGNHLLANAAIEAVKEWRFRPALHDGTAYATEMNTIFIFR